MLWTSVIHAQAMLCVASVLLPPRAVFHTNYASVCVCACVCECVCMCVCVCRVRAVGAPPPQ